MHTGLCDRAAPHRSCVLRLPLSALHRILATAAAAAAAAAWLAHVLPRQRPPHSAAIARQCSCARALAVWLLAAAGSRADRAHRRAAARAVCAGRRRDDCGAPTRLQLAAHESRGSRRHGSGWHSQCVQRPMAHLSRATHDVPMAQRRATCAVRRSVAQQRNGVTVPTGVRRDRVESARAVAPARPQRERHRPRRAPAVRHVPARQLPDPGRSAAHAAARRTVVPVVHVRHRLGAADSFHTACWRQRLSLLVGTVRQQAWLVDCAVARAELPPQQADAALLANRTDA